MVIVTTVYDPSVQIIQEAKEIACFIGVLYVPRGRKSIAVLRGYWHAETIIVVYASDPRVQTEQGELFFHPGMTELRIKNIIDGKPDHMTLAMQLDKGMSVLDCTLGLGTDSIVLSWVVGECGKVDSLEKSPLVAFITGWGLSHFSEGSPDVVEAMRRIAIKNVDYRTYLPGLASGSFDVVYFDPMFSRPVAGSTGIRPLRWFADYDQLDEGILLDACRIARQRVVIKDTRGSPQMKRLGISRLVGGKYSAIQYGVIERGDRLWID